MTTQTVKPETLDPQTPDSSPTSESSVAAPAPERPRTTSPRDDSSRCHYRYANGRRCSLPGLPSKAGLCLRHFNLKTAAGLPLTPSPSDSEDLSADLLPQPSQFDSAKSIGEFLSRLLKLITQGRVTPRRAAVLAYITNQLLRTIAVDIQEARAAQQDPEIIFDLPRPKRD